MPGQTQLCTRCQHLKLGDRFLVELRGSPPLKVFLLGWPSIRKLLFPDLSPRTGVELSLPRSA
jgi:hypothetical protein